MLRASTICSCHRWKRFIRSLIPVFSILALLPRLWKALCVRSLQWSMPDCEQAVWHGEAPSCLFRRKDFQQIAVIRRMVELEGFEVEIVDCPIVREADGLAFELAQCASHSRRPQVAPGIHRVLAESVRLKENGMNPGEVEDEVVRQINSLPGLTTEYFSIVDAITMQPLAAGNRQVRQVPWAA